MEELKQPAGSAQQENTGLLNPQGAKDDKLQKENKPNALKGMGRYFHQSDFLFKIGISLVTAFSAAAVIVLSGIYAERLTEVIAMRACIGFFLSGVLVFLATLWLDDVGIPLYVSRHEELQQAWLSEPEEDELLAEEMTAEAGSVPEHQVMEEQLPQQETAETSFDDGGDAAFAPLGETVRHMHTAE